MVPACTKPFSGTSLLIVAPLPMRAPAPIFTLRLTVTPIPTSTLLPICTSPARIAPGERFEYSPIVQSCDTITPVLTMRSIADLRFAAHVCKWEDLNPISDIRTGFDVGSWMHNCRADETVLLQPLEN